MYFVATASFLIQPIVNHLEQGNRVALLLSAANTNESSAATPLVIRDLRLMSGNTTAPVIDSGNSNPDSTFRYEATLGGAGGGYIFNLSTKALTSGQYVLSFYAGAERSFFYTVKFEVR